MNRNLTHFLVAGHRHWTKDQSAETALLKWIEAARPNQAATVEVFLVDSHATVDSMGGLHAGALHQLANVEVSSTLIHAVYHLADEICDAMQEVSDEANDFLFQHPQEPNQ